MKILVTGGAGYIGSFMTVKLLDLGHEVIVLDNLNRGSRDVVDKRANFFKADVLDKNSLKDLFSKNKIDSIFHFAGLISMEESVKFPELYFENNFNGSLSLIGTAVDYGVNKVIFSSTAGVYGNPTKIPIPEDHQTSPTNPYGESKLKVERALVEYNKSHGLNFVSLRYFNAAGASLDGRMGENHEPETHIIPLAIRAVLQGIQFNLYGTDYPTDDGTCVRDYIHIIDLVESHVLAMEMLQDKAGGFFFNIGTGVGYSNRQVISEIEKVSGIRIKVQEKPRRPGDAEILIADPAKAKSELGFSPKYSDMETIVKTAWKWHSSK